MQGSGIKGDPYVVFTYEDMLSVRKDYGAYVELGADVIEPDKRFPAAAMVWRSFDLKTRKIKFRPCNRTTLFMSEQAYSDGVVKNGVVEVDYIDPTKKCSLIDSPNKGSYQNLQFIIKAEGKVWLNPFPYSNQEMKCVIYAKHGFKYPICTDKGNWLYLADEPETFNGVNVFGVKSLAWASLPSWVNSEKWEIKEDGLNLIPYSDYYYSGVALIEGDFISNRRVIAVPADITLDIKFATLSGLQGEFYLGVGGYNGPMLLYCYDEIPLNLCSRYFYKEEDQVLPKVQNGYFYTCTKAGTTDILPDILPTSGTLISGTAEFSVSPLRPPVIYGPVTPAKKV